jgi:hypothetical protein
MFYTLPKFTCPARNPKQKMTDEQWAAMFEPAKSHDEQSVDDTGVATHVEPGRCVR